MRHKVIRSAVVVMMALCAANSYQTIVCICVGGPKNSVAATILRMFGYDNTYFLGGGIKGLVSISALDNQGDA